MPKYIGKNAKLFIGGQEVVGHGSWEFHTPLSERIQETEWVGLVDFREFAIHGELEFDPIELRNVLHSIHNMVVLDGIPRIS